MERRLRAEREQSAGAQQPRRFRHGAAGIGERHRTVIAEHDVERCRGGAEHPPRWLGRAGTRPAPRPSTVARGLAAEPSCRARRSARKLRERDRPLRRAAAELEDVLAAHVAEHVQLRLRDRPDAPRSRAAFELPAVPRLVVVGVRVPVRAVLARVFGQVQGARRVRAGPAGCGLRDAGSSAASAA